MNFSAWHKWTDRNQYPDCRQPGVYAVAKSAENLAGVPFTLRPEIVYIGMTNSLAGLRGRLAQFDSTISGKRRLHGGAERVVFKHSDYAALAPTLYVAFWSFRCDPRSNKADDLRMMGEVTRAEYECWARCVEELGQLPEFNRKKDSPKRARTRPQPAQ